jgi:hypothetical protein
MVSFLEAEERASVFDSRDPMPPRRRRKAAAGGTRRRRRVGRRRVGRARARASGGGSKVRVVKGRVSLKVAGFPGYQRLAPGQLVRHVPITKLRAAAKKILGRGGPVRRRRRATGRRRRRRTTA